MQNEELRLSQVALDAARARYFDLYDMAPVGYCTLSEQGLILQANLAAASLLGVARGALDKRPISLFILNEDQDVYYLLRKKLLETGDPQSCELRMLKHDGTQFWVHLAATAAHDADGAPEMRAVMSDITARKRAEEALLKALALQSAIFSSANFASIATDAKGIIQIFNVGAERMLGYAAADVIGKVSPAGFADAQEVIARANALSAEFGTPITPGFGALVYKAWRGINDIYELTYIRKNGSRVPAAVSVTALRDAQNAVIGYLLIGTDNTARKQVEAARALLEQSLQEKNTELERAKSVAERASLAKSEFLSNMSHELRTPLNAILGFAQLMESGSPPPTPSQKRRIDQVLHAGWYLLELINEILDLALIESGKLSLSMEPVSLVAVMYECEAMIEPQAQKRGISVVFPQLEVPYFVKADRTRVKQILINLLSNAIKYNQAGGTVRVDCFTSTPGRLRICVEDTGEGLSPKQLTQLFQPFNRLGKETGAEEGTGIGLVVSKRLIELMGGVIDVESAVGKGSVFWIELNLTAEPQPATEPTAEVQAQAQADVQLRTLLYVEDNPANLMLVEDLVARRPEIRLLSAMDGRRGIEIARSSHPDVILMDINLPGISGIQALEILAADPATARIPVIAISANAMPRDIEKGLAAGFFRYLTKPIKVNEFMNTLDVALELAKAQAVGAAKKGSAD
ncbi:MAG: hybrid sensor histidine kinase/response regulator [Burkholderiales bacterium]